MWRENKEEDLSYSVQTKFGGYNLFWRISAYGKLADSEALVWRDKKIYTTLP